MHDTASCSCGNTVKLSHVAERTSLKLITYGSYWFTLSAFLIAATIRARYCRYKLWRFSLLNCACGWFPAARRTTTSSSWHLRMLQTRSVIADSLHLPDSSAGHTVLGSNRGRRTCICSTHLTATANNIVHDLVTCDGYLLLASLTGAKLKASLSSIITSTCSDASQSVSASLRAGYSIA